MLLEHLLEKHKFPNGLEHIGKLADVVEADWRDSYKRNMILEKIKEATATSTGFSSEFYATKQTYLDDALKCYSRHGRPKEGCGDYCDGDKRIGNPTRVGWETGPRVFLCHFCPVESYIQMRERHVAGAYKEN